MKKIILLASIIGLSGCQSVGMVGSPLWHMTTSKNDKIAAYRETCVGYGFVRGTPEMAQCISTESRDSRASASDRMRAFSESMKPPQTINCTSTRTGTIINTNCR